MFRTKYEKILKTKELELTSIDKRTEDGTI